MLPCPSTGLGMLPFPQTGLGMLRYWECYQAAVHVEHDDDGGSLQRQISGVDWCRSMYRRILHPLSTASCGGMIVCVRSLASNICNRKSSSSPSNHCSDVDNVRSCLIGRHVRVRVCVCVCACPCPFFRFFHLFPSPGGAPSLGFHEAEVSLGLNMNSTIYSRWERH